MGRRGRGLAPSEKLPKLRANDPVEEVRAFAREKYGNNSWETNVEDVSRKENMDSILRHFCKYFINLEDTDVEGGFLHMAAVEYRAHQECKRILELRKRKK